MKGRHNLTIFLDNFSTSFRRNSTRKIVRWFEEFINLNHLTIFYNRISSKTGRKVVQENSAISLALIAARSVCHLALGKEKLFAVRYRLLFSIYFIFLLLIVILFLVDVH